MVHDIHYFCINFIISGSAAVISKTMMAPIERTKLILQNQDSALQILSGEREKYKGFIDILRRVPKEQGFFSLWRGNGTNVIRYFPTQALNFAFYDYYKHTLYSIANREKKIQIIVCKLVAGGLAGGCSSFMVYPLDFCQTRLTVDIGANVKLQHEKCQVKREFGGLTDCIRDVWRTDGIRGLYKGAPLAILGLTIYRSLYFCLFDVFKAYYSNKRLDIDVPKPPLVMSFIMAQLATVISGLVAYPLDTVSRRMMLDSGRPDFLRICRTPKMTIAMIYKKSGISGFYKGVLTNIIRCTAGALVLVMYDEFLHYTKWKQKINEYSK